MSTDTPVLPDPARSALLVMDYQNGILPRVGDPDALLARAQDTIGCLRDHGVHIGYVRVVLSAVRDAHDRDYRLIVLCDLCADPEPDVHAFLLGRILPRQAEVITSQELRRRLPPH